MERNIQHRDFRRSLRLEPTADQTFILTGGDLRRRLERTRRAEEEGDFERACRERFDMVEEIAEALPDDEAVELDWGDDNSRAAMETMRDAAVDALLAGQTEIAAAQLELLLDSDPEDHTEATPTLAMCYVALGDRECFEDTLMDIDDRSPVKPLLKAWDSFRRNGRSEAADMEALRRHRAFAAELCADDHTSETADGQASAARELWFTFEPLVGRDGGFLEYLKRELQRK